MIGDLIAFVLGNFTLTFLVLGLIATAISLLRKPKPFTNGVVVEELFAYFLLFEMGLAQIYNGIFHIAFGKLAAEFIGWADSPFQTEVGFASLGFGALGILAFRGSYGMRTAAVVGPLFFFWGAAAGHIYQMITAHNFAPGNAGIIFYTDLLIPAIGLVCLWLTRRDAQKPVASALPAQG